MARHPGFAPRVPEDVQLLAKTKAAACGETLGQYITRLIQDDTAELADFLEKDETLKAD